MLLAFCLLPINAHAFTALKDGGVIKTDTTWTGRVEVSGIILVPEDVTLTIAPGTVVAFIKTDRKYAEGAEGAQDEVLIPGSGIRVEGKILAEGTKAAPITFTSAEVNPAPGAWGCIFIDHSKGDIFRRCRFEYSAYTIHAHFSTIEVSRCLITHNEDGSRLGLTKANFDHCDIKDNTGKGLNFRQCNAIVTWCNITGNLDGLFFNEKDTAVKVENCNVHDNGKDLRLGEFHTEDVRIEGVWWGSTDINKIGKNLYDKRTDEAVGAAIIRPAAEALVSAGLDGINLEQVWHSRTNGFVDSTPVAVGKLVYFGSWDKTFYAMDSGTGKFVWGYMAKDSIDSTPLVNGNRVIFCSWDRNIYCVNAKKGGKIWQYEMPPSNFDDHRQSSPVAKDGLLYVGNFNGGLYALSEGSGAKLWEFASGGPVRSAPMVEGGLVYFGSGDGNLYAVDRLTGERRWSFATGGPVHSSPVISAGMMYFGSEDGNIYSLDALSGKLLWKHRVGGKIVYSSPLVADGKVIIGDTDGRVNAVAVGTGDEVWTYRGNEVIYSSPRIVNGRVVISDNAGCVRLLELASGRELAVFRTHGPVQGLSVGADGIIYAGSRDFNAYALRVAE